MESGPVMVRDAGGDPVDLAWWGLHCYCPTARRTPHSVVAEGSNGRLLYEARTGVSLRTLRGRGVPATDGQLTRLVEFGLVAIDGDVVRTIFPILGRDAVTVLRRRLRSVAESLAGRLDPLVGTLRRELARMNLASSAYAVVFGHALDGLVWTRLAERDAVPDTALCADRPWWNGAFWAVYPAREGAAGTNFVDCGDATLVQVWTEATVARLDALAASPGLPEAVHGLLTADAPRRHGDVVDDGGVAWRLRGADGRPAIPVLGVNGPLDDLASRLADVVADALAGDAARTARAIVPCDDHAVATVVVAHELIWDVTDVLVASGTLDPAVGAGVGAPTDLLFVVAKAPTPA